MTSNKRLSLGSLALLVFIAIASAARADESTPEERARAVTFARQLEQDPLAADSMEKRKWLLELYEKSSDLTVTICDIFGPLAEDHPFLMLVVFQSAFSQGAYLIEHSTPAADKSAALTAGMLGALRAYERFAEAVPAERLPFLDDLVTQRDEGTLSAYMTEVAPRCLAE